MERLDLMDSKEVAELLSVHRQTIYNWVRDDKMPQPISLPGRLRWLRSDIVGWIGDKNAPQDPQKRDFCCRTGFGL